MRIIRKSDDVLIYIHPIRNGGTTLENYIDKLLLGNVISKKIFKYRDIELIETRKYTHYSLEKSLKLIKKYDFNKINFITTIRNPYSWIKSVYLKTLLVQINENKKFIYPINKNIEFKNFLNYVLALDISPQQSLIFSNNTDGNLKLPKNLEVLLFENLEDVASKINIFLEINKNINLNQLNNTSENKFREFDIHKFFKKNKVLDEDFKKKFEYDFFIYNSLKKDTTVKQNKIFNFEVCKKLSFMNIDPWWFLLTNELTPYLESKKFDKKIINLDF